MFQTVGRIGWLAVMVLAVCVLGGGTSRADGDDEAELRAAFDKGKALQAKGQYPEALPYLEKALELAPRGSGEGHEFTATILNNLALLYANMGQYDKAEPLYQRSLSRIFHGRPGGAVQAAGSRIGDR